MSMAKSNSGIHIDVKVDARRFSDQIYSFATMGTNWEIGKKFKQIVDPYVPYDTGNLSKDVTVSTGEGNIEVIYNAPYAKKVYYGDDIAFHKDKHPLATAYWDKVAMQTEREHFAREVEQIIKKAIKENGQE